MNGHPSAIPLIDRSDFNELLSEGRFGCWSDQACDLHRNGFCVLDIGDETVERDCAHLIESFSHRLAPDLDEWEAGRAGSMRIQDAWRDEAAVRRLSLQPVVLDLLRHLYGREPFAFQTLNFAVGSQQPYHSDAVHFHSEPHGFMCGVWIPLADVQPDSGPLIYYPGSHRLPYQSAVTLGLTPEQIASEPHPQRFFEPVWQEDVKRLGLQPKVFLPRRGQALIWHANLLHGGSAVVNRKARRWSQVVHYFFKGCLYTTPMKSFRPDQGGACLRTPMDIATGRSISASMQRVAMESGDRHAVRSGIEIGSSTLNQSIRFLAKFSRISSTERINRYKGNLELVSPSLVTGWVYHPDISFSDVRLVCGDQLLAFALIEEERVDVCTALGLQGSFGFRLEIPVNHPVPHPIEKLLVLAISADGSEIVSLQLPGSLAPHTESRLRLALSPEFRGLRGHFDGFNAKGDVLSGWCYSPVLSDVRVWLHADGLHSRAVPCNVQREYISAHPQSNYGFKLPVSEWPDIVGRNVWASFDSEGELRLPPVLNILGAQ